MAEHPVKRKLRRDLLPYLISARRLRRQWFYWLHVVFGYTTDLIVALTAIGVSTPILAFFGTAGNIQKETPKSPTLLSVLESVPSWLIYPTIIAIILWIFLRVAFNREEGEKRAVLAKSCFLLLKQAEASLPDILSKSNPMPDLTKLLEMKIRPPVDRNIQEQAWPWTPFAPGINVEVEKELQELCSRYEVDWEQIDSSTFQQRI